MDSIFYIKFDFLITYVIVNSQKTLRNIETDIQSDVKAIGRISIVPMLLDVICRTTNMGFAAIARVTEDRWVTCSVLDKIAFGLGRIYYLP
jgi:hypothetical protein